MIGVICLNPAIDNIFEINDFIPGSLYRANSKRIPGGKGVNVSKVLSSLGVKNVLFTILAGNNGKWIKEELEKKNIKIEFVEINGETRSNTNIIDLKNLTETEILEEGPVVNSNDVENIMNKLEDFLGKIKILVISGSILKGFNKNIYFDIINMSRKKGIFTILDSSGDYLKNGLKSKPNFVKPNLRELSEIFKFNSNDSVEIIKYANKLLQYEIDNVLISLGKDGSLYVSTEGIFNIKIPNVNKVNTIGCGDALTAGLAYSKLKGFSMIETLKFSHFCAISNALEMEIGLVDLSKNYLIDDIIIEKLKEK